MIYVVSTISLVIQVFVLGLLLTAVFLKSKKKYRQHGMVMLSAVALHIISIIIVMVPSFGVYFSMTGLLNFADTLMIVTLFHVSSGLLAAMFGIWLVSSWHLKTDLQNCFRKKLVMDVTFALWTIAIVLGIFLYLAIIQAF